MKPAPPAMATPRKGIWATNAPRLSNMSDWYMARQLQNFRDGIRGGHPQDFHGAQMASMAKVLADDEAIADLLDYVRTLITTRPTGDESKARDFDNS